MAHRRFLAHRSAMPANRHHSQATKGGRWFLAATGLSLVLLGSLFVWLMARSYLRARKMHAWPQVECVVLHSEIETRVHDPHSPREYRLALEYGYEVDGTPLIGTRLTARGNPWSSKRNKIEKQLRAYPSGQTTRCYTNPERPDFAVLKPDSLAPGYSIWFPGLFVVAGMVIMVRAVRR